MRKPSAPRLRKPAGAPASFPPQRHQRNRRGASYQSGAGCFEPPRTAGGRGRFPRLFHAGIRPDHGGGDSGMPMWSPCCAALPARSLRWWSTNNAAAVLLTLSALTAGGEVITSRGEPVEIGRLLPDAGHHGGLRRSAAGGGRYQQDPPFRTMRPPSAKIPALF